MDVVICGQLRRHLCEVLHAGHESISAPGNGDDEIVLVRTLAKRPSQRRYLPRQVVLVDGRARPDTVQELIFADDLVSMFEQRDEHVEGFRRNRHETAFPPQPSLEGVDNERPEGVPSRLGRFFKSGAPHVASLLSRSHG